MFTMLLVSANTIAMSVRERTREVGVLKVLGFTRETVLGLILTEAVAVSLIGGVVGVVLATGLTGFVRQGPAFMDQMRAVFEKAAKSPTGLAYESYFDGSTAFGCQRQEK